MRDYQPRIQNSFVKIYKQNHHAVPTGASGNVGGLGSRAKKMQMRQDMMAKQQNNESINKGRQRTTTTYAKGSEDFSRNFEQTPTVPFEMKQISMKLANTEEVVRESSIHNKLISNNCKTSSKMQHHDQSAGNINISSRENPSIRGIGDGGSAGTTTNCDGNLVSVQHNISQIEIMPQSLQKSKIQQLGSQSSALIAQESNSVEAYQLQNDSLIIAESEEIASVDLEEQQHSNYGVFGNPQQDPKHKSDRKSIQKGSAKSSHHRANISETSQNMDLFRLKQNKDFQTGSTSDNIVRNFQKNRHQLNKSQNTNTTNTKIEEKSKIYTQSQNNNYTSQSQQRKSSAAGRWQHQMHINEDSKLDDALQNQLDSKNTTNGNTQFKQNSKGGQSALASAGMTSMGVKSTSALNNNKRLFYKNQNLVVQQAVLIQSKSQLGVEKDQQQFMLPQEDTSRQISLPQLKQISSKQNTIINQQSVQVDSKSQNASQQKRGKQVSSRQHSRKPYHDEGILMSSNEKKYQPDTHTGLYHSQAVGEPLDRQISENNYCDSASKKALLPKNTFPADQLQPPCPSSSAALPKDKPSASSHPPHYQSAHKERYSTTSPYSNGPAVMRAMRQMSSSKEKEKGGMFQSNNHSERVQQREKTTVQCSLDNIKVQTKERRDQNLQETEQGVNDMVKIGKNQVILAYSQPNVQQMQHQQHTLQKQSSMGVLNRQSHLLHGIDSYKTNQYKVNGMNNISSGSKKNQDEVSGDGKSAIRTQTNQFKNKNRIDSASFNSVNNFSGQAGYSSQIIAEHAYEPSDKLPRQDHTSQHGDFRGDLEQVELNHRNKKNLKESADTTSKTIGRKVESNSQIRHKSSPKPDTSSFISRQQSLKQKEKLTQGSQLNFPKNNKSELSNEDNSEQNTFTQKNTIDEETLIASILETSKQKDEIVFSSKDQYRYNNSNKPSHRKHNWNDDDGPRMANQPDVAGLSPSNNPATMNSQSQLNQQVMPPIIVTKSQISMSSLKNNNPKSYQSHSHIQPQAQNQQRYLMTDQKGQRKYEGIVAQSNAAAARYEGKGHSSGIDIMRMQPTASNMKYDLIKIQQQIKNTQKEQKRLEKDLQILRRDKANGGSNPDLNLHNYFSNKRLYDSSKDIYKQPPTSLPKQKKTTTKPQSKKHSILGYKQQQMKQVNSVVNIFNKNSSVNHNVSAEDRVVLKPVSSRATLKRQNASNNGGNGTENRQRQRTPGSSHNSSRQFEQQNDLETIQTNDIINANKASSKQQTIQSLDLIKEAEDTAVPSSQRKSNHKHGDARQDKHQGPDPKNYIVASRSNTNSRSKYIDLSNTEEDHLLSEVIKHKKQQLNPTSPIDSIRHGKSGGAATGLHYQTISSSRKNSQGKLRAANKPLEGSYSPKKLAVLSQQKKSKVAQGLQVGTFREAKREFSSQNKIFQVGSGSGVLKARVAQKTQLEKLGSLPRNNKDLSTPSDAQKQLYRRNQSNDEPTKRWESPMKLRDQRIGNQQDIATKRGQYLQNNVESNVRYGQTPTKTLQYLTNSYLKNTMGGSKTGTANNSMIQDNHVNGAPQSSKDQPSKEQQNKEQPKKKKFKLENLEVLKQLGQGSFGKVKLVRHSLDSELYAMKCLQKEAIRSQKQIQHIRNEKQILEKIKSVEFCCNIHEILQDEVNLYMILDYLPGGELFLRIKNQVYLNEDDARFYLAEIVLAIEQLHDMNILYRDLKPENILIDREGHIKLIDFGFSKHLQNIRLDRAYTNCGTAGYCAPEVMLDAGYSYKADIWSLGILICEMIGGFIPFQNKLDANNPRAIMEKCRSGTLNLPKNLSSNARDLVKSILAEDPSCRPDLDQIKQHGFFRTINWKMMAKRGGEPPFLPQVIDYFEEPIMRTDSFNIRNQEKNEDINQKQSLNEDIENLEVSIKADYAGASVTKPLGQSRSTTSFPEDNSSRRGQLHQSDQLSLSNQYSQMYVAQGQRQLQSGKLSANTTQSLPQIVETNGISSQNLGKTTPNNNGRLTSSNTRKLEQIPESVLDATNNDTDHQSDSDPDSQNHHHHHQIVPSKQISRNKADNIQSSTTHSQACPPHPLPQNQHLSLQQPQQPPHQQSYYSSKKYSATGGTGGLSSTVHRKVKMPTKVLGDYQMQIINKAFVDF